MNSTVCTPTSTPSSPHTSMRKGLSPLTRFILGSSQCCRFLHSSLVRSGTFLTTFLRREELPFSPSRKRTRQPLLGATDHTHGLGEVLLRSQHPQSEGAISF